MTLKYFYLGTPSYYIDKHIKSRFGANDRLSAAPPSHKYLQNNFDMGAALKLQVPKKII